MVLEGQFYLKLFSVKIVQLPGLLMANQKLHEKHARNFSYTVNPNGTRYIALY